jgi:hypothetical protein
MGEGVMMESDQDNEIEIDVDVWLQYLLAMTGDKDRREELIQKISTDTGQIPENIEKILAALLNYLTNKSRSN